MKFCRWLLVLWILCSGILFAQPFTSRSLSLQEGLPEYYVSGLVQDKAGFVWIATRDGLARYDGLRFKVFRHQPYGKNSLANNAIRSMQSFSDTTFLIQLENGSLQTFNPVTERFEVILSLQQLERGHIRLDNPSLSTNEKLVWAWNATQIDRLDRRTRQVKTYPIPGSLDSHSSRGNSSLPKKQPRIYFALFGRLIEFDPQEGNIRSWNNHLIGARGKIETYYGIPIVQRTSGEILTSAGNQLLSFNPLTGRFNIIPIPSTVDTQVGLIYKASDDQIYFTYGMTVYHLSKNNKISPIWTAPRIDFQNYFHALLVDRSGVLWIGTNGDGVQQIDLQPLPIKSYPYRTNFFQDVMSVERQMEVPVWAETSKFLYQLRLEGNAPYMTVAIENWFYLLRGDHKSRKFQVILRRRQSSPREGIKGGNAIRVRSDGTIWMYEPHQGILKADSTGHVLEKFDCPEFINWVTSIQPLGQTIWIGSEESGLYAYDLLSRRIVHHMRYEPLLTGALPSDHVQCLAADVTDPAILWVGTKEGLCRLNTRNMSLQNWSEEQGLPSGTINTLLTDQLGNLWFSTGKGISRMNPKTRKMRHFTIYDGLQDIEYRPNHAMQLRDGRMAFGGATGITVFDPLKLNDSAQPIPTVLTSFRLTNVPVEPGKKDSPLDLPINATNTIRLKPNQNFFGIEYAGMQYSKPASLRYRYQLKGVDARWVDAGSQTLANYTQVEPGDYEFRVNTAGADGRWSPLVKTIKIIIDPPWWATWWFYLLVTIFFLSSFYGFYRYRLAQVLRVHNLRNGIARDLHDDVGSSISSIAIFSNIVLDQVGTPAFKSEPLLIKITEQANEIMGSMNDIVWSINTKNDAFESVFIRMREHAFQLLTNKGYSLHFDFDENLNKTKLEMEKRRDFYLIYKEALNNIAKYAEGKNVWISVHLINHGIDLVIRDDGKGFETNNIHSNGNGLSNMGYRTTTLNGTLHIVSELDKGTTIHLSF